MRRFVQTANKPCSPYSLTARMTTGPSQSE